MVKFVVVSILVLMCVGLDVFAETPQLPRKEPGVALILSLVISGGGQFYNGEPGKGFGFLIGEIVTLGMMISAFEDNLEHTITGEVWDVDDDDSIGGFGFLLWAGLKIGAVVDAYKSAGRINRERGYIGRINFRLTKRGAMVSLRF